MDFYRPQRSCGQGNIFTPVCHSVHGGRGSASMHAGIPPLPPSPGADTPPWSRQPPGADTPLGADTTPPRADPPGQTPPRTDTPQTRPPQEADSSIRSMSGQYTSYWNAFLFGHFLAGGGTFAIGY